MTCHQAFTALTVLACSLSLRAVCSNSLTPLIQKGLVEKAQNDSRLDILGVESYSGFFTVNQQYDSNMFFWFFPAKNKPSAPVLLWLNGGPGRSSLYGALLENGPLALNMSQQLELRNVSWTESFSMLYMDNPVGVGFSYTKDDRGFSRTMDDIATNLYSALVQFFQMFPQYTDNDVYIGGQSYAGKYIPPLGYHIHNRNHDESSPPEVVIKMKGIYLGGGFCDPIGMAPAYLDYLYSMGIITGGERKRYKKEADQFFEQVLSGKIKPTFSEYFEHYTRSTDILVDDFDNVLGPEATWRALLPVIYNFLRSPSTATLLRASGSDQPAFNEQELTAVSVLIPDFLNDTVFHNNFLLRHYKVLHYSGNLDVVVSVPMTEAFLYRLHWPLDDQDNHTVSREPQDYRTASRKRWEVDDKAAGWYTTVGSLTRVIVRNAGHAVPHDQPQRGLEMMRRFVAGEFE